MSDFDPVKTRESTSAKVLRCAAANGQAAELLDALASGGNYQYNERRNELLVLPRTYLSEGQRDAISITLTQHSAGTLCQLDELGLPTVQAALLRDEILAKLQHILDGIGTLTGQVGFTLTGIETDEIDDTMEHGPVVIVMRDHWAAAMASYKRLGLLYGAKPDE